MSNDDIHETPSASPNFRTELAAQLADLVPEAIADGKVDVEKLKELLETDAADGNERFGLFWPGKKRALRVAQEPTTATLKPDFENSKDWDTTKNVFIEGDNLEVLKILQRHYHGKIKMIYIDPPYNTGKDFVYNDNFRGGVENYLQQTGQLGEDGKKLSTNSESDGRYHSNWLNMMYPRLKLARQLLTSDGLLVASIDDNELPRLTMLLDEIFGTEDVKTISVKMSEPSGVKMASVIQNGRIPKLKESLVIVKRGGIRNIHIDRISKGAWDGEYNVLLTNATEAEVDRVRSIRDNPDRTAEELAECARIVAGWRRDTLASYLRRVGNAVPDRDQFRVDNAWRICQIASLTGSTLEKVSARRATVDESATFFPFVTVTGKVYLIDRHFSEEASRPRCQLIFADENLTTHPGDFWADIKTTGLDGEGGVAFKNGKKPLALVERIVAMEKSDDFTVLDFFAGSGTTGEAVARVNARDGGNRRYILVQLPEELGDGSSISSITRRRLSSMEERVELTTHGVNGFRAFKLADTNFAKWRGDSDISADELQQRLDGLRDSSDDDATPDDLFTEILLKQGFSLTERIESREVAGADLRAVLQADGDVAVLAYLDEHTKPTLEQLRAFVAERPSKLIVLEDAFAGDDELKTNLAQLCKTNGIELWTA